MEKMTFKQKIENFWYHNKVATIVISLFAIFIIVATVQLFTKDSPDANFIYLGPAAVAFQGETQIQESIGIVMKEDYNKDGKKYIDYIELTALDPKDDFDDDSGDFATGYTGIDVQRTVGETFAAQIIAGDSMIYLLDEKYFNVAKDTGVLMPLSEALGYTPDFAVNEYAVYLNDLEVYYLPGFKLLPESTMICIRYPVTLTNGKKEVEERERCNLSVFRDMFSYVYPDKPEKLPEKVPQNISLEEFKVLLKEYGEKKKTPFEADIIESAILLENEGFFEVTGANLFKVGNVSYLVYCSDIFVLGKHIGGQGINDFEICDFDRDGKNDIIFSYTYKNQDKVVSSVSVFNLTTLRETFLSIESPLILSLEKNEKEEVDIFGDNILLATIYGDKKDILIKFID